MRRLNGNGSTGACGFTLVELLLAITLMSILLGLTYSGLRAATRSTQQGERLLAAAGDIRAAHQFVRRQLNQMLPLPFDVSDDAEETRVVIEGSATRLQYVAPMPGYLGTGGPQVQLLELAEGPSGRVLQFSHALLQGFEQERLFDRDPIWLLEGVEYAQFEYLGRDEDGELTGWVASWDQQDILPVAVRLSIDLSEEFQLLWPELVAGVRVDEQSVSGGAAARTYEQSIKQMINRGGEQQ